MTMGEIALISYFVNINCEFASLFIFLEKIYAQRKCPWGTKNRLCSRIAPLSRAFAETDTLCVIIDAFLNASLQKEEIPHKYFVKEMQKRSRYLLRSS